MKINQEQMKNISFPDYRVEKMEYLPLDKNLKIFINGAWLETAIDKGYRLGRGVLFFNNWESISITRYYAVEDRLESVIEFPVEPLTGLYEVNFSEFNAILSGFGKETYQWLTWEIINVKMHAEFEDLS